MLGMILQAVSEKKAQKWEKVVDMVSDTMLECGHAEQKSR